MLDNIAGILITGGWNYPSDLVMLLQEDWTSCELPSLPVGRSSHTQVGLEVCGGYLTPGIGTSCVTFAAGKWSSSHSLSVSRNGHVSWASYPGGVLLMGGSASPRSTELLSRTSSTTTAQFELQYDTG